MMQQGTQINYMPDKSHVIISLLSTHKAKLYKSISQGKIVNIKSYCRLQIPLTARTLLFSPQKGAF